MQRYTTQEIQNNPRLANKFFYKAYLMKGFGYRYHFSVGDEFVVDTSIEASENSLGQMTNKVYVAAREEDISNYTEMTLMAKPSYNTAIYNPMIPEELRKKQGQRVGADNLEL